MAQFIKLHFNSGNPDPHLSGFAEFVRPPSAIYGIVGAAEIEGLAAEDRQLVEGRPDESVARAYLNAILSERGGELSPLTAPDKPEIELVPDLRLEEVQDFHLTPTRVLKFVQTSKSVPVFGTAVFVEIDGRDRWLVSADATLTDTPNVSAVASLSAVQAWQAIQTYGGTTLSPTEAAALSGPELTFFCDTVSKLWHLVYYFRSVPITPPDQRLGTSPRDEFRRYDYLVDAHQGEIVFYFSSQAHLDVPTKCKGLDEFGHEQQFDGLQAGGQFRLIDPMRNIETFDHGGNDVTAIPLPIVPISHIATDFAKTNPAGVSAHYFATVIFDFFNHVLKRNGIDGKGMKLLSLVNATNSKHEKPPNWRNAVWWNNRMWYGRVQNAVKGFDSYARYFDIIAHELTHGVTQTTAGLVYRDQSGALNESFSDIFGVIIKNWHPGQPQPIVGWDWEIGAGLGAAGGPLRDLSNPAKTGQPDHMNNYLVTTRDDGGVHTNSGIHNKAAYNFLTAQDAAGKYVFTPGDVTIFYYLTLTRLTSMSGFSDCLRGLKSVISTYYAGDPLLQQVKLLAVTTAYQLVGIV
jgi:bacillolysin